MILEQCIALMITLEQNVANENKIIGQKYDCDAEVYDSLTYNFEQKQIETQNWKTIPASSLAINSTSLPSDSVQDVQVIKIPLTQLLKEPTVISQQAEDLEPITPDNTPAQTEKKIPQAGNLYFAFSPISWHLDDIKSAVNDFPWGVGLAYDFGVTGKPEGDGFFDGFIMSAEFSIFKDSDFGYPSAFIGTSFRKNVLEQLQLGISAGLIYTTQLEELSGSPVLPFIFPIVQSDFDFPVNLRVIYIPPISDLKSQQVFITIFTKIN